MVKTFWFYNGFFIYSFEKILQVLEQNNGASSDSLSKNCSHRSLQQV